MAKRPKKWIKNVDTGQYIYITHHFKQRVAERFGLHDESDPKKSYGLSRARKICVQILKEAKFCPIHQDKNKIKIVHKNDNEAFLKLQKWIIPIVKRINNRWAATTIYPIDF